MFINSRLNLDLA